MISLTIEQNSETISSWFSNNQNWFVPLLITLFFSAFNAVFAFLNYRNAKEQRKIQQLNIKYSLSQKRLDMFQKEKSILESVMDELPLTSMEIADFFRAEHESVFFFDEDVRNHIQQVSKLINLSEEINDNVLGMDEEIFNELKRKELSDKAQDLFLESIDLYERYIDFCDVGKADSRKNKK